MLERDVEECGPGLGEDLGAGAELSVDVQSAAARAGQAGRDRQRSVDRHGLAVAHEDPCGDRGKAIPGGEQPARLVERGADEASVDDPRPALVPGVERERGLVGLGALLGRHG
jgi:hypothetical protein